MCTSRLRALIVAYGWILPREVEMVSDCTGLSGKKRVKRVEQFDEWLYVCELRMCSYWNILVIKNM